MIAVSEEGSVWTWDMDGDGEATILMNWGASVTSAAFSPDHKRLMTKGDGGNTRVWDLPRSKEIGALNIPLSCYYSQNAFNHDGTRLAASCFDAGTFVWRVFPSKKSLLAHARALLREEGED